MVNANNSPQKPINLLDVYEHIPHTQAQTVKKLHKLIGNRWIDLLFHIPSNTVDRSKTTTIKNAEAGQSVTLKVKVLSHKKPYHRRQPYKILTEDESSPLTLIFFHHGTWLTRAFPEGEEVIIHGKIEGDLFEPTMAHPMVWPAKKGMSNIAKIWPVYPMTAGLQQSTIHRAIKTALDHLNANPPAEWLPQNIIEQNSLPTFAAALTSLHNPQTAEDILPPSPHRIRLATDEIYANQTALLAARMLTRHQTGISHPAAGAKTTQFIKNLPFPLTGDQNRSLEQIHADLSSSKPMLRLLQGDVGSGKTVVALSALLRVVEGGRQGALMAPTELLANQIYQTAHKWLTPLGVNVAFLSGSLTPAAKKRLKKEAKDGLIDILIGTHALVQKDVIIPNLGLVIIDEQHRFGVGQRLTLGAKDNINPDILVMTATPIPRSLALTMYGDMDISIIREKPPGREPITTIAKPIEKLSDIILAIKRKLAKGEQIYWVCPLVEESEKSDLAAAAERYEDLYKIYGTATTLLHGKMKPAEKEAAMQSFVSGETQILVSTTVIEVGIDVPAATTIIIEHAERFGLAQLHQLRGRVGRGGKKYGTSSCILLYSSPLSEYANQRIKALRASDDGFTLAEQDLELRGAGEVLGTKQSGAVSSKLVDYNEHAPLIPIGREAAIQTLTEPNSKTAKATDQIFQWHLGQRNG